MSTLHSSLITPHSSLITHHSSLITHHSSLITHHSSVLTHHFLLPSAHLSNVYTFKDFEGSSHRILIDLIRHFSPRGGVLLDLCVAGGEHGPAASVTHPCTRGFNAS